MSNNKQANLVQVVRNNSYQVPLYVVRGKFDCKLGKPLEISGGIPDDYAKWGITVWFPIYLSRILENDLGGLIYRSVSGDNFEQVLQQGNSIPNQRVNDTTYATNDISKALEYGYTATMQKCSLQQDVCVILYDPSGLQINKDHYEVVFLKDPRDILKGVVLIKPDNPQTP